MEAIDKFESTVVPHPVYSSNFAPSDYYLFCKLKDEHTSQMTNNLLNAVKQWFKDAGKKWYRAGIQALLRRGRKMV